MLGIEVRDPGERVLEVLELVVEKNSGKPLDAEQVEPRPKLESLLRMLHIRPFRFSVFHLRLVSFRHSQFTSIKSIKNPTDPVRRMTLV